MKRSLSFTDKILFSPLWIITLMPLRVLYLISEFFYIILYYMARYRRDVVMENLRYSFPEKSPEELKKISKKFFRYLCDYFIESIYMLHLGEKESQKRYRYTNPEVVEQLHAEGRSFILATSHFGNWEWAVSFCGYFQHTFLGVYKPLENHVFDRLFIYMREKLGPRTTPMQQTLRSILECRKNKELFALYMVADQRPSYDNLNYWNTFMNREAPIITGIDKLSRRFDLPVVFCNIARTKRGYYSVNLEILENEPVKTKENTIAEKYIRAVEKLIRQQPELYLWSHKRWKYKR